MVGSKILSVSIAILYISSSVHGSQNYEKPFCCSSNNSLLEEQITQQRTLEVVADLNSRALEQPRSIEKEPKKKQRFFALFTNYLPPLFSCKTALLVGTTALTCASLICYNNEQKSVEMGEY